MTPIAAEELRAVAGSFDIPGRLLSIEAYGSGHINGTYRSAFEASGGHARFIHQRINRNVFPKPEEVMDNIARVLEHLRAKLRARGEPDDRALTLVPARDGRTWVRDGQGEYWRTYRFIEGSRGLDLIEDDGQARRIAAAAAAFIADLADLDGPPLHQTIPAFHDARRRYRMFRAALETDAAGRAGSVRAEIDWFLANEDRACVLSDALADGRLPARICHNDTKANNILLDESSGEALCVIDLDTVMGGSALYDFGDLVRTATGSAAEDESEAARMRFLPGRFRALARGFCGGMSRGGGLTPAELSLMPEAGRAMAAVIGIRFLTDYLSGDVYYKCARPGHNRDRCRTQIALASSMDESRSAIEDAMAEAARAARG